MQKPANSKAQSAFASIYGGRGEVKYRIQIVRKQNSDTPRALQFMVGAAWMAAHTSGFASGRPVFAAALLSAAVNLTAEPSSEPPRGGEHGAGENLLNRKRPFAESRN